MSVRSVRLLFALAAVSLALGAGCRSDPAVKTYPATGRVVVKGGGSLAGGVVEFQSLTDSGRMTSGKVEKDGSFTLSTLIDGKRVPGAVEGPYRVTVIPPMGEDQTAEPISLPQTRTVEARDNSFTLEVERP